MANEPFDLAMDIASIRRNGLVDADGRTYAAFRSTLTPRYWRVWAEILAGHAALLMVALCVAGAETAAPSAVALWALLGALGFGFGIHYLNLFIHEAAHYNLHPNRRWNDALANVFLGVIAALDVRRYRVIHFDHHRYLGTPRDTERSYFEPLNLRFVLESLTGVRLVLVLMGRRRAAEGRPGAAGLTWVFPASALLHASLVVGGWWAGFPAFSLAWALGVLVVTPFLLLVRQVLEHRSEDAVDAVDYTQVPHGAVNRLFGNGPFALVMGGAGFHRHLLHHWDPQVSCTRLEELESFLMQTSAADVLRRHRTTYAATFRRLFH